jgi:hypothetical protein
MHPMIHGINPMQKQLNRHPSSHDGGFSETPVHRPGLRRAIVGPILAQACAPPRRWPKRRILDAQLESKVIKVSKRYGVITLLPNGKRSQNQSQEARGLLRR